MRSKKVELWMPWQIYESALADSKRRGYKNVGRYFIGLSIRSMMDDQRHETYRSIANENPKRQDHLFCCLKLFMDDSKLRVAAVESAAAERKTTKQKQQK